MLTSLSSDLEAEQRELDPLFLALVLSLYEALRESQNRAPSLAATLAALGVTGFSQAFLLSGEVQRRTLRNRPVSLETLAERAAKPYGRIMQRRVQVILKQERSEAQLRAYASLLNSVSTNFGSRAGFEVVGTQAGATRKRFERFRPAKEPRPHSALKGRVITRNALWTIDGYKVPAPADPRLPLSSRLRCSHTNIYLP